LFDGDKVGLGWPDQPVPADASERQLLPATSKAISKVGCNSLKLQDLAERGDSTLPSPNLPTTMEKLTR
jgi:hypothetical protein